MPIRYYPARGDEFAWRVGADGLLGRGTVIWADAGTIVLSLPPGSPNVEVRNLLQVRASSTQGLFGFACTVLMVELTKRALVLRQPEQVTLIQRRRYVRLPLRLRVSGNHVYPLGPPFKGVTVDLSGGGMKLQIEGDTAPMELNGVVRLVFTLPIDPPIRTIASARIVRLPTSVTGHPEIGLEFEGLPEAVRDRIIGFIQQQEVDQRKSK